MHCLLLPTFMYLSCVCFNAIICCNGVPIICINFVYEPCMYLMKAQFIVCLGRTESLHPSTFNYTVLFSTCDWYCFVPCPISYPALSFFQRTITSFNREIALHYNNPYFWFDPNVWASVSGLELKTFPPTTFLT